jgi:TonB family protein
MSAHRSLIATLALIATQVPIARGAEATPPAMQLGDTWTFRLTTSREGAPGVSYRLRYSVARRDPAGRWIIAEGSANEVPRTIQLMKGFVEDDRCIVDIAATRSLQPPPCTATMQAGDHWTELLEDERTRAVRVLGTETLHVPAGTFDSIRLEAIEQPAADAVRVQGANSQTYRALLWYAPALGIVVRAERDVLLASGSPWTHSVEELESSRRGDPEPVHTNRLLPPELHGSHAPQLVLSRDCSPQYPPEAFHAHATGTTGVRLAVDAEGRVTDSELIGASGPTAEHRQLDAAARASIARCRFKPATSASGEPQAATANVQYRWRIE